MLKKVNDALLQRRVSDSDRRAVSADIRYCYIRQLVPFTTQGRFTCNIWRVVTSWPAPIMGPETMEVVHLGHFLIFCKQNSNLYIVACVILQYSPVR